MPAFGSTPETLLGRNDSKNPATTCRGITNSGRACRRALNIKDRAALLNRSHGGVVAVVPNHGPEYYCWQHQDQAIQRAVQDHQQNARTSERTQQDEPAQLYPLQEQASLEDLFQQLGLEDEPRRDTTQAPQSRTRPRPEQRTPRKKGSDQPKSTRVPTNSQHPKRPSKQPGFWASLCCLTSNDNDDYVEIVRHRKRVARSAQPSTTESSEPGSISVPTTRYTRQTRSETHDLLSYIPTHLSPSTATTLLNELVKPISPTDEEGYIYIFWLTSENQARPDESTAQSLLAAPPTDHRGRRISDVLTEFSFDPTAHDATSSRKARTVMLKIGRANNVTRRMNEWQRQCGYTLSLIRWYPYLANSQSPGRGPTRTPSQVRKVPCVRRVERLVHLELADAQVKQQCQTCDREHREWFEVEATQAGIRAVDDCVRRWVRWAELKTKSRTPEL